MSQRYQPYAPIEGGGLIHRMENHVIERAQVSREEAREIVARAARALPCCYNVADLERALDQEVDGENP